MGPDLRSEAIILRRTNYGEADRIIVFLTPVEGKVTAIAKGVRRPKSKLAGGLELFATCDVTIKEGRGELGLITSARLIRFYGTILHDYERMQLGYECIKLVNRTIETISEPDFYSLLRDAFMYLDSPAIDHQLIELWFRLRLRDLLGAGLNTATTPDNQPLKEAEQYTFNHDAMAFTPQAGGRFGAGHIKLLRLLGAKNPAIVRQVSGVEAYSAGCLWLLRQFDQ